MYVPAASFEGSSLNWSCDVIWSGGLCGYSSGNEGDKSEDGSHVEGV